MTWLKSGDIAFESKTHVFRSTSALELDEPPKLEELALAPVAGSCGAKLSCPWMLVLLDDCLFFFDIVLATVEEGEEGFVNKKSHTFL